MYRPDDRERVRADLIEIARADPRIGGGALTGSASVGHEDRWSDIDLAFGVVESSLIGPVIGDWTARMYERHGAVHHVDVRAGTWLYRVFLLANSLQVDVALAPLVTRREPDEIARAFAVLIGRLTAEIRETDGSLAAPLEPALRDLLSSTRAAVSGPHSG